MAEIRALAASHKEILSAPPIKPTNIQFVARREDELADIGKCLLRDALAASHKEILSASFIKPT